MAGGNYQHAAITSASRTSEMTSRRGLPSSHGVKTALAFSSKEREVRLENGQCPTCGQQLFHFQKKGVFDRLVCCTGSKEERSRSFRKVPLSVPNLVHRGQCLSCDPKTTEISFFESVIEDPNEMVTASLISSSNNSGFAVDRAPLQTPTIQPTIVVEEEEEEEDDAVVEDRKEAEEEQLLSEEVSTVTPLTESQPPPIPSPTTTGSTTAIYEGEYNSRGLKHGSGVMTWSNGDVYTGSFVEDRRDGFGRIEFADGGEYVGEWRRNYMHGNGRREYPNGDVYEGRYYKGRRDGEGKCLYKNGNMYCGNWKQNTVDGFGRYYYPSGQRFEGYFVRGKRNGKGKLQKPDGSMEIFQYINDERVGEGVRWSENRTAAWRLWIPQDVPKAPNGPPVLRKQQISVDESFTVLFHIEQSCDEHLAALLGPIAGESSEH